MLHSHILGRVEATALLLGTRATEMCTTDVPRTVTAFPLTMENWERSIISQQSTGYINCGFFMNVRHTGNDDGG